MSALAKSRRRARPVMNVTPLVDVVLVLLIIFMVVIPLMEQNAPVDLPSIFNVDEQGRARNNPLEISLQSDGSIFLEMDRLAPNVIEQRLREAHEAEPNRRLVLRADREAPYEKVRALFAMCAEIGFPGIAMRVNQAGEDGPSGD
jgi:biopolymer transport protein ExbD/biopolymer transport protein TolR